MDIHRAAFENNWALGRLAATLEGPPITIVKFDAVWTYLDTSVNKSDPDSDPWPEPCAPIDQLRLMPSECLHHQAVPPKKENTLGSIVLPCTRAGVTNHMRHEIQRHFADWDDVRHKARLDSIKFVSLDDYLARERWWEVFHAEEMKRWVSLSRPEVDER
ncbi:hypothetical protein IAT40_004765 [Kwoniella sp. CBS 6097]